MIMCYLSCSSGESRSDMEVRVRSEVYVENFGGDVSALIDLCSIDVDDAAQLDEMVTAMTPDVLEALQFVCSVLGERVAVELR